MSVAVIQGASGSIGSHLARQLLANTRLTIVGTSRNPEAARAAILGKDGEGKDGDRLKVIKVDARDEKTIERAAEEVREMGKLRALINTSGVLHADKSVTQISAQDLLDSFQLNTFAHILTYKHFVPLLPSRAKTNIALEKEEEDLADGAFPPGLSILASLTARVGSIGDNKKGGWVSYRASKAATNQVIQTLQRELSLRASPAIALALHPGTVVGTNLSKPWTKEEDAGKKPGVFTAEESAIKLLEVLKTQKEESGGRFLDWDGKEVVW